jgi:HAMP domain-containing protein
MNVLSELVRVRTRRGATPATTHRLAASIRLPWSLGLAVLVMLAIGTAVLVGRTGESTLAVPEAMLDYQEGISREAAQSVRHSLNEGVKDLDGFARVLGAGATPTGTQLRSQLEEFASTHRRYAAVIAVDRRARVLAQAGRAQPPTGLVRTALLLGKTGVHEVPQSTGQPPLIEEFAPVHARGSRLRAVIGYHDAAYLRYSLDVSRPGNAWVVNNVGQVVGMRVGKPRLESPPRLALRAAAVRGVKLAGAHSAGGSLGSQEIIGHAPVAGRGPAGRLRWSVVTSRDIGSFALPQTRARRQGVIAGVALGVATLLIFGWLYVVLVSPLLRLQSEAERLARGDLSRGVPVVRYDEIGLIARSLERLRISSIRKRVESRDEDAPLSARRIGEKGHAEHEGRNGQPADQRSTSGSATNGHEPTAGGKR